MGKSKYIITIGILIISNLNCRKDISLPEVVTIGVNSSEWWNGINYLQFVYIGEGRVISDGGGDLISKGICYSSTNESPTINDSFSSENITDNESFICKLNLQKGQVKYYLRTFAKNKAGISYGTTVTYTTYCGNDWDVEWAYKLPPMLRFPSNGATGLPLSVELSWIKSVGGSYDIYLDTSPDTAIKIASDVTSDHFEIDNLKSSTTYYWKVVKHWSPCIDISSGINNFATTQ